MVHCRHTIDHEQRANGLEFGLVIVMIGNKVWLGGNMVVCPSVTVREKSVIVARVGGYQ